MDDETRYKVGLVELRQVDPEEALEPDDACEAPTTGEMLRPRDTQELVRPRTSIPSGLRVEVAPGHDALFGMSLDRALRTSSHSPTLVACQLERAGGHGLCELLDALTFHPQTLLYLGLPELEPGLRQLEANALTREVSDSEWTLSSTLVLPSDQGSTQLGMVYAYRELHPHAPRQGIQLVPRTHFIGPVGSVTHESLCHYLVGLTGEHDRGGWIMCDASFSPLLPTLARFLRLGSCTLMQDSVEMRELGALMKRHFP